MPTGMVGRGARGQRDAHRAGDAQRGRAADGEHLDRVDQLGDRAARALDALLRQPRLVEEHHRLVLEADDVVRLQQGYVPSSQVAR